MLLLDWIGIILQYHTMFELITLQQQLYGSMFIQNECYIQNCTQSTCQYSTAHMFVSLWRIARNWPLRFENSLRWRWSLGLVDSMELTWNVICNRQITQAHSYKLLTLLTAFNQKHLNRLHMFTTVNNHPKLFNFIDIYAVVTCEMKLFPNHFGLRGHQTSIEII